MLWALFLALSATLCAIVSWRYAIFRNDVDLGIFTQVVASLGHGFSSTAEGGVNHLAVHWSPIIATSWPFLRLFGPRGLEYLQAVAVAAVVFPIWGLARARFNPTHSVIVVALAAIYPILWANGVGDFHEMAFVPVLSAALVYALDCRRWTMCGATALLLLCTKEDQFVILAANGLLFALTARSDAASKRAGWIVCGAAIAMSFFYFGVLRQAVGAHVPYTALGFFNWTGTPLQWHDLVSVVLRPRIEYVLVILAPLAFLPCISRYGLFLIPGFVEILASHQPITLVAGAHYSGLLTGYALAGFVDGLSILYLRKPLLAKGIVAASAVASVYVQIFESPMEYWYYLYRVPNAHDRLLAETLAQLPPRADVGAEGAIFSHLGLDPNASVNFSGQEWFVYDRTYFSSHWERVDDPAIRQALIAHKYVAIGNRDGIVVLKRSRQ